MSDYHTLYAEQIGLANFAIEFFEHLKEVPLESIRWQVSNRWVNGGESFYSYSKWVEHTGVIPEFNKGCEYRLVTTDKMVKQLKIEAKKRLEEINLAETQLAYWKQLKSEAVKEFYTNITKVPTGWSKFFK